METKTKAILILVLFAAAATAYFMREAAEREEALEAEAADAPRRELVTLAQNLDDIIQEFDRLQTEEIVANVRQTGQFPSYIGVIVDDISLRTHKFESELVRLLEDNQELRVSGDARWIHTELPAFKREYQEFAALETSERVSTNQTTVFQQNHLSQTVALNQDRDGRFDQDQGRRAPQLPNDPTFRSSRVVDWDDKMQALKAPQKETATGPREDSAFQTTALNADNSILMIQSAESKDIELNNKRSDEETRAEGFIGLLPNPDRTEQVPGANDFDTQSKTDLAAGKRHAGEDTFNTEVNEETQDKTIMILDDDAELAPVRVQQKPDLPSAFNQDGRSTNPNDAALQRGKSVVAAMQKAQGSRERPIEIAQDNEEVLKSGITTVAPWLQASDKIAAIDIQVRKLTGYNTASGKGTLPRSTVGEKEKGKAILATLYEQLKQIPISLYGPEGDFTRAGTSTRIRKMKQDAPDAEIVKVYDAWAAAHAYVIRAKNAFQGKSQLPMAERSGKRTKRTPGSSKNRRRMANTRRVRWS